MRKDDVLMKPFAGIQDEMDLTGSECKDDRTAIKSRRTRKPQKRPQIDAVRVGAYILPGRAPFKDFKSIKRKQATPASHKDGFNDVEAAMRRRKPRKRKRNLSSAPGVGSLALDKILK